MEGDKLKQQGFTRSPIGSLHVDIAEVQTAEVWGGTDNSPVDCCPDDWLHLFVGIDRTRKFAFTQLSEKAGKMAAARFLRDLIAALPYRLHTVLTDRFIGMLLVQNTMARGVKFANRSCETSAFAHIFDHVCRENEIWHRLTELKHFWMNGQVERMNRTAKDATVKRLHHDDHSLLHTHLADFIVACNFARRLKALGGLTSYEYICKFCTSEPDRFIPNPIH